MYRHLYVCMQYVYMHALVNYACVVKLCLYCGINFILFGLVYIVFFLFLFFFLQFLLNITKGVLCRSYVPGAQTLTLTLTAGLLKA